jgi:DNA primase
MGRIPDETIDAIRDRFDLLALVGRYVSLKKQGSRYVGLCPFHDEKAPSFSVNPEKRVFHCFGCGASGDGFEFLMRHDNLTFREAVESAARECGIEIPATAGGEPGQRARLLAANQLAWDLYRSALLAPEGAAARAYLEGRGLGREEWARFGVGFASERWEALSRALAAAGVAEAVAIEAGLLARGQRGGVYDRLRGRIVFPIQDARGRVIAFGGRALGDAQPKYLNTPETSLFRKRETFYGLPAALEAMRRRERAVVVEGYFDRIACERAGVAETVATCGTALAPAHASALRRRTRCAVLLFDGDDAGRRALEAAAETLLPEGLRVLAAALPPGEDPDSLAARDGPDALRARVEAARPAVEVVIEGVVSKGVADAYQKADAVERVAPLLARVPSAVERREFARRLALLAGVDPRDAEAAVAAARGETPAAEPPLRVGAGLPAPLRFARRVGALLLAQPELAARLRPGEPESLLEAGPERAVLCALAAAGRAGGSTSLADLAAGLGEAERRLLHELACAGDAALEDGEASRAAVLDDTLDRLRGLRDARLRESVTRRLVEAAPTELPELLAEKQRQLERRRATQGLDPRPPAPGGVELLR